MSDQRYTPKFKDDAWLPYGRFRAQRVASSRVIAKKHVTGCARFAIYFTAWRCPNKITPMDAPGSSGARTR